MLLEINLKNCYGIKELKHKFDFTNCNTNLIYAKNGSMKTSFAKTFQKYQEGKQNKIKDYIFDKPTTHIIKIDESLLSQTEIADNIFVLGNIDETYQSKNISNLLLNEDLKNKFDTVLELKFTLLQKLKEKTGLAINNNQNNLDECALEKKFLKDFGIVGKTFLDSLDNFIIGECNNIDILYKDIFDNGSNEKIIESAEFQNHIDGFINKTNEIYGLTEYSYLEKGRFSFGKFKEIQELLNKNDFFVNNNSVNLNGNQKNKDELQSEIDGIKRILTTTNEFIKISDKLNETLKGKKLLSILENNLNIVAELKDYKLFQKKLWHQYLNKKEDELDKTDFEILKEKYKELKDSITIENLESSKWKEAVTLFNERFSMPFKMKILNIENAVFGEIPIVKFCFSENNQEEVDEDLDNLIIKDKDEIRDTLSLGEKRALYLLNIIFDIENFKKEFEIDPTKRVILIIDDVADSFDYKNKYAIVEYLKEISEVTNFYSIILTHNFDFFRFINKRLKLKTENSFEVFKKEGDEIELKSTPSNEPWEIWKRELNEKNVIALIPFIRNLIEYGENNQHDYLCLTHLLHKKIETKYFKDGKIIKLARIGEYDETEGHFTIIKMEDIDFIFLEDIYKKYLGRNIVFNIIDKNKKVNDEIKTIANSIGDQNHELENKIILSIAIRLEAEQFIKKEILEINPNVNIDYIDGCQFGKIFDNYINICKTMPVTLIQNKENYKKAKSILTKVNIMTPENIHLNSFMYEPILDMDIIELKGLYNKVKELNN